MPMPPNMRFTATGRNGANSSRMKSGSKRETLLSMKPSAPCGRMGKTQVSAIGGTRNLGQAPYKRGVVMKANERARHALSPWQLYPAFGLAAVLLGCATQSGPPLSSLATLGGPPKGMARIVVVRREKGFFGWQRDAAVPVKLDGEPLGELMTSTFAYLDRPAGPHQLSTELWGWPGVTRHDFTALPGRTYFFRASVNEKFKDVQVVSMISPLGG